MFIGHPPHRPLPLGSLNRWSYLCLRRWESYLAVLALDHQFSGSIGTKMEPAPSPNRGQGTCQPPDRWPRCRRNWSSRVDWRSPLSPPPAEFGALERGALVADSQLPTSVFFLMVTRWSATVNIARRHHHHHHSRGATGPSLAKPHHLAFAEGPPQKK